MRHHRAMPDLNDALPDLDARFERLRRDAAIPGVAWGVLRDGLLVHAGGAGTARDGEDRRPDADTVFRIASMTKSFTAAMVLLLRDEQRLRLDDAVAAHVPALRGWRPFTADAAPVTIRDLLTMTAGLATDDPWGDRQQGLPIDAFERLLAAGPSLVRGPGVAFEYSNLGYGILGRVVTAVAGAEYRDVVRARLLVPLGMTASVFEDDEVPEARLAHGYVRRGETLVREGEDRYGALASMGGLFSSVRDLSTWAGGWLDAFPARDDPEGPHPLRRSTRREAQQVQRSILPEIRPHAADAEPAVDAGGYGFGLGVVHDPDLGTFVGHAGGYPGFGSYMGWHPATGLGIVALGNRRYAPMRPSAMEALEALVRADLVPRRRVVAIAPVEQARDAVEGLLAHWDDGVADALFAMNMELDEPRELRRTAVEAAVASVGGPLRRDPGRPALATSPAELVWWMRGERGWLHAWIQVTPEPLPLLQALEVRVVADPSTRLASVAARVLVLAGDGASAWPPDEAATNGFDGAAVARSLHAAGARYGTLQLGLPIAGDGITTETWAVHGERGKAELRVTLDGADGPVAGVVLRSPLRGVADEGW
jgi:CubicO group peptidase (beta-lactamase class C family)